MSSVLTAAVNLFWTALSALAAIAPLPGLMWLGMMGRGSPAEAPAPEQPPDSGIVVRIEDSAIWIPEALRDLARHHAGLSVDCSLEEAQTYLEQKGWRVAWYALTRRGHQVNGGFAEIIQVRRLSDAGDHLDEFQSVMAAAAGRPARFGSGDFPPRGVLIIPDTLQIADPREAITQLLAKPEGVQASFTQSPAHTKAAAFTSTRR
jgi:hypothetical protein